MMDELLFQKELLAAVHQDEWLVDGSSLPTVGEIILDDTWTIVNCAGDDRTAGAAATDLREFFADSMRLSVPVASVGQGKRIVLTVAGEGDPESYSLEIDGEMITVTGGGSAGVLYGVYALEEMMKFRGAPALYRGTHTRKPVFETRIYRSPLAHYHGDELLKKLEAYPETMLRRLSHQGFNGIWLHSAFRDMVTTSVFPEFGEGSDERLARLNDLIQRAAAYNIKVYIYLTEPLGLPENDPFFDRHPHVRGMRYVPGFGWGGSDMWGGPQSALCTSTPEVQLFLRESTEGLFTQAPGLGGLILISASEHHHHCYSHVDLCGSQSGDPQFAPAQECPRCTERPPAEVVAEIINTIHAGATAVDPQARIIAWSWSWGQYEPEPQTGIISRLAPGVIVMAGFEAGTWTMRDGREYANEEYSLTRVGPSGKFHGISETARATGHRMYAKIQVGTTHESANIPYLPVMGKVALKMERMREEGVGGYMGCWNFGNFLSPVTELVHFLSWEPYPDSGDLLQSLAVRDFGKSAAPRVLLAWEQFCAATDHYPFCQFLLGLGIHTRGPAYPFSLTPTGAPTPMNWMPIPEDEWGDDHSFWTDKLGVQEIMHSYAALLDGWVDGVRALEGALPLTAGVQHRRLERQIGVAWLFYHQILSTYNFLDFIETRNDLLQEQDSISAQVLLAKLEQIIRLERDHCRWVPPILAQDPLLGFHGEAFTYLLTQENVERKIKQLDGLLTDDIPAYRARLQQPAEGQWI
ncbi:MAG: glycoside hydrolase family 20 zincin-like fold domain-containing protein [Armatimonadota bacterium]